MTQPLDPLLAAIVAKLPPGGTDWLVDRQKAWHDLIAMAFGTVYGGDAAAQMAAQPAAEPVKPAPPPAAPKPKPKPTFYIDLDNCARKSNGDRILASQVQGDLVDLRGMDGDMKTIVWADDSTGLNGRDLVIVAG